MVPRRRIPYERHFPSAFLPLSLPLELCSRRTSDMHIPVLPALSMVHTPPSRVLPPVHVTLALSMVYARLVYVRPSLSSVLVYLAVVTRCTRRASPYLSFTRQTSLYRTYRLSASPGLVLSLISSISIQHASVAFTQLNPLHCFAIYSNIVCEYRFRISVLIQVRTFRA